MADMDFFDLLKEKMAALRPSAKHRANDWDALTAQLDQAMPQQAPARTRAWVPLLLLLLALLLSNALWWQGNRENRQAMQRVEVQLAGLQSSVAALKPAPPIIQRDTVWRTVYIQRPEREQLGSEVSLQSTDPTEIRFPTLNQNHSLDKKALDPPGINPDLSQQKTIETPSASNQPNSSVSAQQPSGISLQGVVSPVVVQPLPLPQLTFLKSAPQPVPVSPDYVVDLPPKPHKPTRPFGPLLLHALKPKYFKVGALTSWVHPLSPALTHQVGVEFGTQGAVGFSRHWSLTLEYSYGQLHYEADKPEAILGMPEFPALPSPEYQYFHLDLQRQAFRQFGLGLRYTFSEWHKSRPFIGLNWGNQTVLPFRVNYDLQHEPSSTIQKSVFNTNQRIHLRNYLRLGAGLVIPLSDRFDLTAEGFFQRQVKKKNIDALDIMGIRLGANWTF